MATIKKKIACVGEDVEILEASETADGNANFGVAVGNSMASPPQIKNRIPSV